MADTVIAASLTLNAEQANTSVGNFKKELREAQSEVVTLSEKFGATSKEAQAAAKRAAELKDAVADSRTLIDSFNPDRKFNAFAGSIQAVTGGFAALQGVMGLLGNESEELQRSLLKVQSALAISQGVDSIRDSVASVKILGAQLVQNLGKNGLIGVAIAGVAALGLALSGVFGGKQRADLEAYNDTLKDYSKAAADARKQVIEVRVAFEQAKAGVISKESALKIYNETLGDSLGKTNDLGVAEKNLTDKADSYIKITGLKAQANELFARAAKASADALILQEQVNSVKPGDAPDIALAAIQRKAAEQVKQGLEDAANIEKLGANLLRQVAEEQKKSGVTSGGGSGVTTPRTTKVVAENKEIEYQYSTHGDNLLLIEEENRKKIADGRNIFILEGMRLEEEEFNEKIALLNLELDAEENATRRKIELTEAERKARIQTAQDVGMALGALADLVGKQTAAGKVLAIAQATINTWLGVTEIIKTKSVLPEPLATISRIANIATVLASGFNAVKNIVKTQVPGGGGGSAPIASSPLTPQAQLSTTQLDQGSLNQLGNATIRAFVVESDVQNNSERVTRLNRAARISG